MTTQEGPMRQLPQQKCHHERLITASPRIKSPVRTREGYGILWSSELPVDNITKEQWKTLKEMRDWKDKVFLLVDKGNTTVLMTPGTEDM